MVTLIPDFFHPSLRGFWSVSIAMRPLRYLSVFTSIEPVMMLLRNSLTICSPCSPWRRSAAKFGGISYSRIVVFIL